MIMCVCLRGERKRGRKCIVYYQGSRELEDAAAIDEITLESVQTDRVSGNDLEPFHTGPFVPIPNTFQSDTDI